MLYSIFAGLEFRFSKDKRMVGLFLILIIFLSIFFSISFAADIVYVDANIGDNLYDGSSPRYQGGILGPKRTIQAGVDITNRGGTCSIAAGRYSEYIEIYRSDIALVGAGSHTTIIDKGSDGTGIQFSFRDTPAGKVLIRDIGIIGAINGIRFGNPMEEGGEQPEDRIPSNLKVEILNCLIKGTYSTIPWENDGIFSTEAAELSITGVTITNFYIGIRVPDYGVDKVKLKIEDVTISNVSGGIDGGDLGSFTLSNTSIYNAEWGIKINSSNGILPGSISGKVTKADEKIPIPMSMVKVLQDGRLKLTITANNNGSYTITGLLPGTYTVVGLAKGYPQTTITNVFVASNKDTGNINLALRPSITLISPKGGEVWSGIQTIRWQSENPDRGTFTVDINYGIPRGYFIFWQTIATKEPNDGEYIWDTSNLPPDDRYFLRITVSDGVGEDSDELDEPFTIVITPVRELTITVTYPASKARLINVCTPIKVTFSNPLNISTINNNTMILRQNGQTLVSGSYTLSEDLQTAIFIPHTRLQGNTLYTVNITTGVIAVDGSKALADYFYTFTTTLIGDANSDNSVNGNDLMILGKAFGANQINPYFNNNVNFEKDSQIDGNDLMVIGIYFGRKGINYTELLPIPVVSLNPDTPNWTRLKLLPETIEVKSGQVFEVRVEVNNINDLYGAGFEVIFDPQILEVLEVAEGDLLNQDGQITVLLKHINRQDGRVVIGISRLGQNKGISNSSGLLCKIILKAVREGRANLQLINCSLKDSNLAPINSTTVSNTIIVGYETFNLSLHVYPNPYQPTTIHSGLDGITFENLGANWMIKIYNLAGELVDELSGATNKTIWKAANLASGVYIYLLNSINNSKQTGKIAIIK